MSRISADYLREGAICAQLLAEKYAGRSCNIVEIYGTESSPSAKARSKGFHQALKTIRSCISLTQNTEILTV